MGGAQPTLGPWLTYWAAFGITLALGGCADPHTAELEDYVARVKQRPPGTLDPIPKLERVDTFVYQPGDRRDPFVVDQESASSVDQRQPNGIAPDPLRRKEVLEGYSLDSLRMVGTLEQYDTRWGLITTPEGVLHRVRVGNYMGRNYGQITSIDADEIKLTEIVSDGLGGWREQEASLALKE